MHFSITDKSYLFLLILFFIRLDSVAQNEPVFGYSDTALVENSIHRVNVKFHFNGGARVVKDSIGLVELNLLSNFIKEHPDFEFRLEHHTDSRGADEYNKKLSQIRIENLLGELVNRYSVDSENIKVIGYGESRPILKEAFLYRTSLEMQDECMLESLFAVNRRTILRIVRLKY